ncbi:hypothetical protein BCR42DRAFT_427308 [Absidia repens]|uniref:Uncharacterized protein n=1 Tax=Absidia repens TaxID=90262 RepID=A0A1X2HZL5_9FUNG|nr:hypothetical protein BCR42DRAFT_427308 [Absidia repens]
MKSSPNLLFFFLAATAFFSTGTNAAAPGAGMDPSVGGDIQVIYGGQTQRVPFKAGTCIPYYNNNNARINAATTVRFSLCTLYEDVNCRIVHSSYGTERLSTTQMTPINDLTRGGVQALSCVDEEETESIFG